MLLGYTSLEGATVLDLRMKEFVPDLQARPIVGVIEDYYSGHISKGVRPMLFMVSPTMRGDVYQIACQPGRLPQVIVLSAEAGKGSIWHGKLSVFVAEGRCAEVV